ncbi:MAG: hypothetical protein EG825_04725 [Rhodocyclaceae bacterium]|nr:hypothetical protein [Rhodocyclaceae bacterium]
MKVRKITTADVCEVTGYTRDQLRGMLRDLPPFLESSSEGRNRTFSRVELLTVCIITQLETRYGLKRGAIGKIVHLLLSTLNSPRTVAPRARLNIVPEQPLVTYLADDAQVSEGLLVPLGPIFQRVDHYLGAHSESGTQGELPLSPVLVRMHANQKER